MNNSKWRVIMQVLDKVISVFPFLLMVAVSIGGMLFGYFQNKKMDEEESNNR